ncbi:MAG: helix-turn-helix transcriptional regulator [Anaerolineae bacterium]|nr:helix-turn-helix transcriptional regulator [Anaerolineae bacterium]
MTKQTTMCENQAIHPDAVAAAMDTLVTNDLAQNVARTFQALADPTRVRLLTSLLTVELCVCDMAYMLGTSQSAVSHQLRVLRDLKLVRARRSGRVIYYTLDDDHIRDLLQKALDHVQH